MDEVDKFLSDILEKEALALENMTKEQFVDALKQAISCGDFQRQILLSPHGNKYAVTYFPFREYIVLKRANDTMRALLEETRNWVSGGDVSISNFKDWYERVKNEIEV